jgi:hypothetical protein
MANDLIKRLPTPTDLIPNIIMKPQFSKTNVSILTGALSILGALQLFAAELPVEITSDGPSGHKDGIAYATENVTIKYDGLVVKADRVEYDPVSRKTLLFKKGTKDSPWILVATLQIEKSKSN